jgi:hydrogenase maturation protease
MTAEPRILIAGIGNIFLGDDAFGCEVAKRLFERKLPENVRVVDYGIRGFDLAYALMDGYDVTIFIDATPRGDAPGTIYVIEPDLDEIDKLDVRTAAVDTHNMNPLKVLAMVKTLGGDFKKIFLVGCEPLFTGEEDIGFMGLSEPVEAAIEKAVEVVESLVAKILEENKKEAYA